MKDQKPVQHQPEPSAKTLVKRIQQLEDEKEDLRLEKERLRIELWKQKRKPSGLAGYTLLLLGATALASSIVYESSILAFIGLGLTFWGTLLSFIRPVRYVRSTLLDSTAVFSLMTVDQVIEDLNYTGKGVYLPPRHLKGLKEGTVFIPSKRDITPSVEKAVEGIRLTPSGSGLVNLFERELGTSFAKVDLNYLRNNLPKLFVEGLEIAEDFEMNVQSNMIHVRITGSVYNGLCKEVRKLPNVCNSIGCPLCSSVACSLTRATGKPIIIEKNQLSTDGKTIEAYYRILEG